MSMVYSLNKIIVAAACVFLLLYRAGGEEVSDQSTYEVDTPLLVRTPAVVKLKPGTSISSFGSKVLVRPVDMTWGEFLAAVEWENGVPGYMSTTAKSARDFNFDLTQRIKIVNKTIVVRIERVTVAENDTDEIGIVISKGSPIPLILAAGPGSGGGKPQPAPADSPKR